jgi:hypothetical protein
MFLKRILSLILLYLSLRERMTNGDFCPAVANSSENIKEKKSTQNMQNKLLSALVQKPTKG